MQNSSLYSNHIYTNRLVSFPSDMADVLRTIRMYMQKYQATLIGLMNKWTTNIARNDQQPLVEASVALPKVLHTLPMYMFLKGSQAASGDYFHFK